MILSECKSFQNGGRAARPCEKLGSISAGDTAICSRWLAERAGSTNEAWEMAMSGTDRFCS